MIHYPYDAQQSPTKTCTTCGQEKPVEDFYFVNKTKKDLLRPDCKVCTLNDQRRRHFKKRNPERFQLSMFVETRICTKCHLDKPLDQYSTKWIGIDGIHDRCKACEKEDTLAVPLPVSKVCKTCLIEKPLEQFHTAKEGKYGRTTSCKACVNAQQMQDRPTKRKRLPFAVHGGKVCRRCETEKPFEDFYTDKHAKSGYKTSCKACEKKWRQKEDDIARERRKQRQQAYEQGKHKTQYRENTRGRRNARQRQWMKDNRLKVCETARCRRARQTRALIEVVSYEAILERDGNFCYICEKCIEPHHKIHFDHVIPLARGGTHSEENIKATHAICNRRKYTHFLEEMTPYQRRGINE